MLEPHNSRTHRHTTHVFSYEACPRVAKRNSTATPANPSTQACDATPRLRWMYDHVLTGDTSFAEESQRKRRKSGPCAPVHTHFRGSCPSRSSASWAAALKLRDPARVQPQSTAMEPQPALETSSSRASEDTALTVPSNDVMVHRLQGAPPFAIGTDPWLDASPAPVQRCSAP